MAWKEIETVRRALAKTSDVKVRVTEGGGMHVHLSSQLAEKLGWRDGTTLTLLIGSAEADGKIALKTKQHGPLSMRLHRIKPDAKPTGRVYVGHFDKLARATRKSEEPAFEQKNDQLILTMPEGWLKN